MVSTLIKDPVAGGPTTDGTTIFTDQHNSIVDRLGGETALTASRAVATDANGDLEIQTTTKTELGFVNGVNSGIQAQFDALETVPAFLGNGLKVVRVNSGATALEYGPLTSNIPLLDATNTFTADQNYNKDSSQLIFDYRQANATTNAPLFRVRSSRGTIASPTARQSGDSLGAFQFQGHDGTTFGTGTQVSSTTTELWTASAHGAKLRLFTTPNGSTTSTERITIDEDGGVDFNSGVISNSSIAATQLTGEVADARLSSNVPLLDTAQNFTAINTFTQATTEFSRNIASTAGPLVNIQKSRGTLGAETAALSGDTLGSVSFQGFGTSAYGQGAVIISTATETHTNTVRGTKIALGTTPNGSNITGIRLEIDEDGTFDFKSNTINSFVFDEDGTGNAITNLDIASIKVGSSLIEAAIPFIIDGGGSAITTGVKGYVEIPFDGTIKSVRLLADTSTSTVIDIWKDTFANYPPLDADSITASAVPTITTAVKSEDVTLTGWTTTVSKGDILGFNVDSNDNATRVTLSLLVDRT